MSVEISNPEPWRNPPCPWLPEVEERYDFSITRQHGNDRGKGFYLDALRYAQSQWRSGKPAQAILQLNRAWMTELSEDDPIPYSALVWIMEMAATGEFGFLGNPVRHYQHLASRMKGPRAAICSWKAWYCFHLAERTLGGVEFPRDVEQIAHEGLWIPGWRQVCRECGMSEM